MSYFLNFRSQSIGGGVIEPYVLEGDAAANPLALRAVDRTAIGPIVNGRHVLFAVHGFNVSYERGARSLGQLAPQINLTASDVFFGVLWPGDYWIPVINYPFEGEVAIDCGRRLAAFCTRWLPKAQSLSFVSHSLGARLVLEAVKNLDRPARVVCLTAAALEKNCLSTEYAGATANSSSVSILASHEDLVLKVAYRIADPISEILDDNYTPFQPALGYGGPPTPTHPPVAPPWQIPDNEDYGHGDYLPPGNTWQVNPQLPGAKWLLPARFMAQAYRGQPQKWPP